MRNVMYEEFASVSSHICNRLFSIGEDGFGTRRFTSIYKLFGRYQDPKRKFLQVKDHSYTRTQNSKADSLAQSARIQPSFVVHMDAEFPAWLQSLHESVMLMTKKKNVIYGFSEKHDFLYIALIMCNLHK